jgi:hypothetical protein
VLCHNQGQAEQVKAQHQGLKALGL